ncbi:hypothetical protein [Hyalangium gracile]|uniref:hypothetical protein n=1 Tax=Hyalangium gracile TaxID=394092 RepID=UPI001CCA76B6|nr:hypothetical protein [Hyalangium gracile]
MARYGDEAFANAFYRDLKAAKNIAMPHVRVDGGKVKGFEFDQPKLLDVNFAELSVERVPAP